MICGNVLQHVGLASGVSSWWPGETLATFGSSGDTNGSVWCRRSISDDCVIAGSTCVLCASKGMNEVCGFRWSRCARERSVSLWSDFGSTTGGEAGAGENIRHRDAADSSV